MIKNAQQSYLLVAVAAVGFIAGTQYQAIASRLEGILKSFRKNKKIQIGYWKIRGLGGGIRTLLEYVKEPYEDVLYEQGDAPDFSRQEWLSKKFTLGLKYPNLPYYIDGNEKITQYLAIIKRIGRRHGLYCGSGAHLAEIDMQLGVAGDYRMACAKMVYFDDFEKKKEEFANSMLPGMLATIAAGLASGRAGNECLYFVRNTLSIADFDMYEVLDTFSIMIPGCLDAFPNLARFKENFESLPSLKEYMSSPRRIVRPLNNKIASFK